MVMRRGIANGKGAALQPVQVSDLLLQGKDIREVQDNALLREHKAHVVLDPLDLKVTFEVSARMLTRNVTARACIKLCMLHHKDNIIIFIPPPPFFFP